VGPTLQIDGVEYVTADEAAARLGVKLGTLYAYASRGRIRSYREGSKRRRLYRRDEVDALLELAPARARTSSLPLAEDWIPLTC
jgi:excisionase family DNA binding protein